MLEKGQRYRVKPLFARGDGSGMIPQLVGQVSYIHPLGRYAVLEFAGPIGVSRECFYPEELTESNLVRQKGRR